MTQFALRRAAAALAAVALTLIITSRSPAQWAQYDVPAMNGWAGPTLGQLPDGRFIYGQNGSLYLQNTWGQSNATLFAHIPSGIDPSFIAVWDANTAALGKGGSGFSAVFSFNPSNTASAFASIGTNFNYAGVFADSSSLFLAGATFSQPTNSLRYVTLNGSVNKTLIDYISTYSAGLARDVSGNLYVGNNDDGKVYKFTSSQLANAITGSALTMASGTVVHDFGDGGNVGSLAVDGLGRLWASGWQTTGITMFDPNTSQVSNFVPGPNNNNYVVSAFSKEGVSYISYINNGGWNIGDPVVYGVAVAATIPEPGAFALVGAGLVGLLLRHRRHHLG